jgi:phage gp45-like
MDAKTVKGLIGGAMSAVRQAFKGTVNASNVATENQTLTITGLSGETLPDTEYFQHYGHASRPLNGLQNIAIPLGGKTSHAVVIAVQGDKVMVGKLQPGESIQYAGGGFIHSKIDGTHHVKGDVVFDDNVTIKGEVKTEKNIVADGEIKDAGGAKSMSGMRDVYNSHNHDGDPPPAQKM